MSFPTKKQTKQWRRYLADERAEAAVYRDLAQRRTGEERKILLALAEAEARHEKYWLHLLGDNVGKPLKQGLSNHILRFLARRFGSVFVLALVQRAEDRSPYTHDTDATEQMAADEQIHSEVIRALAVSGRNQLSGSFRAAVFGANDGLVSNLALVIGMAATGIDNHVVLMTGFAGLLAGALSMAAGEYISVKSQKELLEASRPSKEANNSIKHLDIAANELSLVFRARNMSEEEARAATEKVFAHLPETAGAGVLESTLGPTRTLKVKGLNDHDPIGSAWSAAISSFFFFASGAIIPILPYLGGLSATTALLSAVVLVGLALSLTGAVVGVLSGKAPLNCSLRQLAIGYGAATITYILGIVFSASIH